MCASFECALRGYMNNVTLFLQVINDSNINSGQKILFRTSDYHDLVMLYDDGSDVAVWTKAEEDVGK